MHTVFKDDQGRSIRVPRFCTHTVPDVTVNTRVVAVVGIQQEWAAPEIDGWFLSDFFAFWNVLQGMTSTQTWLHCLDLDDLVKKHRNYLHGNHFQRKVVLDAQILAKAVHSQHCPKQIKETLLMSEFESAIESEYVAAKETGDQSILVLMFGHGGRDTYGIDIGSERHKFTINMLEETTQDLNVKVTFLSTACFSGGWACAPSINRATVTAAGDKNRSRSWAGPIGRACGSTFTIAVMERMTRAANSSRSVLTPSDDECPTPIEGEDEAYEELEECVFESLLENVERQGFLHALTFSAKNDAWEMQWSHRTGIPLAHFKSRWDELLNWPTDETVLPEGRQTSGLNGLTPEAVFNKVTNLSQQYLESYKGNENTGHDGALHQLLYMIASRRETDPLQLENAYRQIRYRMELMSSADSYLKSINVPPPKGLQCFEYDTNHVDDEVPKSEYETFKNMIAAHPCLFPRPGRQQGHHFWKGSLYLLAAFHYAGLSKEEAQHKIDQLAKGVNEDLDRRQELLRQDENVSSRREKLRRFYPDMSR
ncbi:MAG: hypothetical protein OHK93_004793 [Ramalina farinacea]|uniref:Uncharacterized protein n=1 Tax=Ramalina farinacea TaxID=258253 RepID=A0AA43QWR2_9LECA|nr:hypothetical protein [Ramalina farinacea]